MTEAEVLKFKELWSDARTCVESEWNYGLPTYPKFRSIEAEHQAEREFGDDIINRILANLT